MKITPSARRSALRMVRVIADVRQPAFQSGYSWRIAVKRAEMIILLFGVPLCMSVGTPNFAASQSSEKVRAPLAEWGVHTVATLGPKFYEGAKTRAVLSYGEVGEPVLELEVIEVKMGWPIQSKVLWHMEVDVRGRLLEGEVCRPAESYCAEAVNLRWEGETLRWDLRAPGRVFNCSASGVKQRQVQSTCTRGAGKGAV
jgi:hypothetical protein